MIKNVSTMTINYLKMSVESSIETSCILNIPQTMGNRQCPMSYKEEVINTKKLDS
jgi:hypothetical protein